MASLLDWLVKERCLWHASPIFDRDTAGRAVFRCPRCMATWPILPHQAPRRSHVTAARHEASRVVHARVSHPEASRALATGH